MNGVWKLVVVLAMLSAGPAMAGCVTGAAANTRLVLAFFETALVDKKVRVAFETYAAPDFIEHKPDVPGGTRAQTIDFLENLVAEMPAARWQVLRSVAEGDMVVLHVRFTPAEGAAPWAIADFFRIRGCRIAEHWDVVSGPPVQPRNPNSRF